MVVKCATDKRDEWDDYLVVYVYASVQESTHLLPSEVMFANSAN